MNRPYDVAINIDKPDCPECNDNEHVWRRVRYESEELQWLSESGNVEVIDEEFRQDIGWSWYCTDCKKEWGHEGALRDLAEYHD